MSKLSVTKTLTAIAAVMSFGSIAYAGDNNVTEDQILQALKPVREAANDRVSAERDQECDDDEVAEEAQTVATALAFCAWAEDDKATVAQR